MYIIPDPGADPELTGFATLALYLQDLYIKGYRGVSGSVSNFIDIPSMGWGYGIETFAGNGGWIWDVELFRATSPDRWFRQWQSNGVWMFDWKHYPTATPPVERSFPAAAGLLGGGYYSVDQLGRGLVYGDTGSVDGFVQNTERVVGTLPVGYRPTQQIRLDAGIRYTGQSDDAHATVFLRPDGTITYIAGSTTGNSLNFCGPFTAGSDA